MRAQRKELEDALEDSPSLKQEVGLFILTDYRHVKGRAITQTRLPQAMFPEACPWTAEQVLDEDFWPDAQ